MGGGGGDAVDGYERGHRHYRLNSPYLQQSLRVVIYSCGVICHK